MASPEASLDERRATAVGELEAFFAEHHDAPIAWIAVPWLHALLVVARELSALHPRQRVDTRVARAAEAARAVAGGFRRQNERFLRARSALFACPTTNQRRSIVPVAQVGRGSDPPATIDVAPDRSRLVRSRRAAADLAGDLAARLRRTRAPFLDELIVFRVFGISAAARVQAQLLIESIAPAIVGGGTNHGPEARGLLSVARETGIPSIYVPHAPLLLDERLRDMPYDYAAMRGWREVEWYVSRGAQAAQMVAAGDPSVSIPRDPVAIEADAAPVVLAPSPDDAETVRSLIDSTNRAVPAGRRVVVSPHPRQDLRVIEDAIPSSWEIWTGRTFDLLLDGPAAVVQFSSGVALEAMLLGIPCVEVAMAGQAPGYPFLDTPLVPRARDSAELGLALEAAVHGATNGSHRADLVEWARSWCAATDDEAAATAWALVSDGAARGAAGPIWDAWGSAGAPRAL